MSERIIQTDSYEHSGGWTLYRMTEKAIQFIGTAKPIIVDVLVRYELEVVADYEWFAKLGINSPSVATLTDGVLIDRRDPVQLGKPQQVASRIEDRERCACRFGLHEPRRAGRIGPQWLDQESRS